MPKFRVKSAVVTARRATHPETIPHSSGDILVAPGEWIVGETPEDQFVFPDAHFRRAHLADDEEARQELLK